MGPRSRPDSDRGGAIQQQEASRGRSRLSDALDRAADAVLLVDRKGRIHEATGAVSELFGRSAEALRGEILSTLCLPGVRDRLKQNLERATGGEPHLFSTQVICDGVVVPVEVSARATDDSAEGQVACIVRDVTGRALSFPVERLQMENEIRKLHLQLLQSQKLEAVGLLGSGMAHDFNNLLNVIMGYAELLARSLPEGDTRRARIDHILQAAIRAGTLTRSLLSFGRKPVQQARAVDLNALIRDTEWMLRRLIGEDVELELRLAEDTGNVKVDPGQLEQVLLNLAVNARHAMLRGGVLTLATDSADPANSSGESAVAPGSHVRITVTDTGVGMDAETQARMFEPFFSTRSQDEGTGLGLATVSGIVQQSGGVIEVQSEPGKGTAFQIYLPRVDEVPEQPPRQAARPGPRGHETVLLAEDQAPLRDMLREALQLLGYRVLVAGHGEAAMAAARRHRGRLDLLVTDVVMPRLDGCELARRLSAERPGIRVLYMSGHGLDTATRRGMVQGSTLLEKPFSTETLSLRVREVLDQPPPGASED